MAGDWKRGMAAGLEVRPARAADLETLLALERAAAEAPHWSRAAYAQAIGDNDLGGAALARDRATNGGGPGRMRRVLVATVLRDDATVEIGGFAAGQVVGMAGAATGSDTIGEIESVVVAAELRRRGLGRALCEELLAWFRRSGAAEAELEVRSSSAVAIALYGSLGFREQGRRRGYYAEPVDDAVLMRVEL